MSDYGEGDLDLLFTMFEGVMQAQEYVAMSLLHTGALDRAGLQARLEAALARDDLRVGTQLPLSRMLEVVKGQEPTPPPRWTPRVIPGKKPD